MNEVNEIIGLSPRRTRKREEEEKRVRLVNKVVLGASGINLAIGSKDEQE